MTFRSIVRCFLVCGVASAGLSSTPARSQEATSEDAQKVPSPTQGSPLLTEPRTPETLFDAVVLMTDLARPGLAKVYLDKLLEADLDDATLLKLRDKHGPSIFLKLSNDKALQPGSITLLDKVNAAFRKGTLDPSRVDKLIGELSKSAAEREVAILQLRNAGTFAAARMVATLHQTRDESQRKVLLYSLTRMNRDVVPVLIGALQSPNVNLKAVVIEALGWLGDRSAIAALWHPAFDVSQSAGVTLAARQALARLLYDNVHRSADVSQFGAADELARLARQQLRGDFDWALNDDGQVELWQWDDSAATVSMTATDPETASVFMAEQWARQAFELAPQRQDLHALYWVSLMVHELHGGGREYEIGTAPGSTFHLGLQLGADIMQQALVESMNQGQPLAATVALQALSQTGSARQLNSVEGRITPVVAALSYPDTRVQFAAATTILNWNPTRSFRGASRVVEVLARSLADEGIARGVAIDANEQRVTTMASALREMGFEPAVAATGQEGFQQAIERGDVAMLLVEANVARWELSQTVANFRADARTAYIPIVIYGDDSLRPRIERLAAKYPLVKFVQRSSRAADMQKQVAPFLRSAQAKAITQPQRVATRKAALAWLNQLADRNPGSLFNLASAESALFEAANDESLAEPAVFALGSIPTASVQTRLFEIGISSARLQAVRERALVQLATHMQRHGVMLKQDQTLELRQAAQAPANASLATAMATVLGTLAPDSRQAAALLKLLPPRKPIEK